MKKSTFTILLVAILLLSACGVPAATQPPVAPANTEAPAAPAVGAPVEITIWDFYGDTTPIKPLIPQFEKETPGSRLNSRKSAGMDSGRNSLSRFLPAKFPMLLRPA